MNEGNRSNVNYAVLFCVRLPPIDSIPQPFGLNCVSSCLAEAGTGRSSPRAALPCNATRIHSASFPDIRTDEDVSTHTLYRWPC